MQATVERFGAIDVAIANAGIAFAGTRGIERRSPRVVSPRWVGPMLLLRGIAQPLIERNTLRDQATLREAIRLAESPEATAGQDPVLGVSAQAISRR